MCESKESDPEVGERFCVWKMQVNEFVGPAEELCEEVESVRGFCYLGYTVE